MKYTDYDIVFQEIPDETTLAINISNCPHRCPSCHSPQLQQDIGEELTCEVIDALLKKYSGTTCVLFMGGDASPDEVAALAGYIKQKYSGEVRTAVYSGNSEFPRVNSVFDYIKLGEWREECGTLRQTTTNQRLYRITSDGEPIDITSMFWKK